MLLLSTHREGRAMAIYRLTIGLLQGQRDGEDDESRAIALKQLDELQARVRSITDMIVYPEDEEAPWGVELLPDTVNLDFDTDSIFEAESDETALNYIKAFLLEGRY
jgi:hypothetical protein